MNDRVVSINSTVEMDLFGQVNSEYVGGHEFSGVGGQRDFMSGAFSLRRRHGLFGLLLDGEGGDRIKDSPED